MTADLRQSEVVREAIRRHHKAPWDPHVPYPWEDLTEAEFQSLAIGKTPEIVEYEDPFALLIFEDGTAIQFYGMSAQSTDALYISKWNPDAA